MTLRFDKGVALPAAKVGEPMILLSERKTSAIRLADGSLMAKGRTPIICPGT